MLFNSFAFIAFFAGVYGIYLALGRKLRLQNSWLLAASWFFYGYWDWRFLGLLILSSSIDYFTAHRMKRARDRRTRKRWLVITLVSNLGILGAFKYFDFFVDSLRTLFDAIGFALDAPTLSVVLPVGLSFYTFQAIGYAVDVYRDELEPVDNYFDYALFVAFFPHMVAGPIQRASNLLAQVMNPRVIRSAQVHAGLFLIVWGYFKKVVIADNAAVIANLVFNNHEDYRGIDIALGTLAFTLQIYGDFSGYSDIARGLSKLMGFDLMLNFRLPYFAVSPSDFWQRWHVSLSTWLRDYLYIPLGGNRGSELRTYRNLMLTMLLGGLWHGAAWNFVAWGLFHGLILIAYRMWDRRDVEVNPRAPGYAVSMVVPRIALMFALTVVGWFLFRARSLTQISEMFTQALDLGTSPASFGFAGIIALLWLPLIVIEIWQYASHDLLAPAKLATGKLLALYILMLSIIILYGARVRTEFIYFQF
jgi:alginate O-acetyltransferase complex protein AlgI